MALSSARQTQLINIKNELTQVIVKTVNEDNSIPVDDRLRTIEFATRLVRETQSFIDVETGQI